MREAIERERLGEAEQLPSGTSKRPWWKFWGRRLR
jgi:hypothetical protein